MTVAAEGGETQAGGGETTGGYDYKELNNFTLIKYSDMNEEMRVEAMELCVTACEKYSSSNEKMLQPCGPPPEKPEED